MGKKWRKVDPAEIKVGDRVRLVDEYTDCGVKHRDTCDFEATDVVVGGVNDYAALSDGRTWYVRKPKPRPYGDVTITQVRPDEPPVGTFFRVDRTGETYWHHYPLSGTAYWHLVPYTGNGVSPEWHCWERITKPGDTITLLDLVEKGDKKDGGV